jgi:succinate dehydrogenase / fumarate reductase membrane anchor subunit
MSSGKNSFQTPLARARGMGASRTGVHHWIAQRVSALILAPMLVYVLVRLCLAGAGGYERAHATVAHPGVAICLCILLVSTFMHAKLGLQVVIEDYVHKPCVKMALLFANLLAALLLSVAGVLAVLRITMGL